MNVFSSKQRPWLLIVVASLGYFVDIYDLVLFGVVKTESLHQIMRGASPEILSETGKFLFNMQMMGMLLGGLLWGILGDKKGRLKALFGSILLYSVANIVNAFVTSIPVYAFIRVIAGIGLAGELGAGVTLVSETLSKERRGYGTMIIVTFGALGAVAASLVGVGGTAIGNLINTVTGLQFANWQVAYLIGGSLGFGLLLLRVGTIDSKMFLQMHQVDHIKRGDLRLIFKNKKNIHKYLCCIFVGVPIWYMIGLLVMNSENDFAPMLGVVGVKNGMAVMFAYIGLSIGDLISGVLSQLLRSRKKTVFLYLGIASAVIIKFLLFSEGITVEAYYALCFLLGIATGYWAIFVTIAAEQFGTNIRSTVANTVPNFVRGSVTLIVMLFNFFLLQNIPKHWSALSVGLIFIFLAFYSVWNLKETFGKNLDYIEISP